MAQKKPIPRMRENYLLVAQASVGAKLFRKLYYSIGGRKSEILHNGDLSCAFFVSGILVMFGLINQLHMTVGSTVADLQQNGWKEIKKPKKGAVIMWAPKTFKNGETHRHIGFYLGDGKAVSNSSKRRSPAMHAWNYRPVEGILWNSKIR